MKISNHLLYGNDNKQVEFRETPNKKGKLDPQYLVMHYTAATEAKGSVSWLTSKQANASAHLIIDRDGSIIQLAPFNIITWHAGKSQWNNLTGLNKYAIGIELVNGGRLFKTAAGWICPVDKKALPDNEVIIARHKNDQVETGWHIYPEVQLQRAIEVATELVKTYKLKDVVGHDDIAPYRKSDPGPAFPMHSFRSKVMGRKENVPELFKTTTDLNIRVGPGSAFSTITEKPLPKNTLVEIIKKEGNWSFVEVQDTVHGLNDLEGWVYSKYLAATHN